MVGFHTKCFSCQTSEKLFSGIARSPSRKIIEFLAYKRHYKNSLMSGRGGFRGGSRGGPSSRGGSRGGRGTSEILIDCI